MQRDRVDGDDTEMNGGAMHVARTDRVDDNRTQCRKDHAPVIGVGDWREAVAQMQCRGVYQLGGEREI